MVLDLFFPKHCVHKDTARYVLSSSKPFGLLSKILVLIWKICFEITHLLNMSHKLGHLSRNFAAEIKNNCIMTLKELLDSLSFDEIAPFLIRHYTYDYAPGDLVPYKQHFDYLRSLTPTCQELIENKIAQISMGKDKLNAYPLEGDDWEDSLAKELVLDKDVKASLAEIAACCLWHTSFWGYLPYQREETDLRLIRTAKFYKNKFSEIIPSKREMMQIPSFRNKIRSDMKSVCKNHPKKNGKKGKLFGFNRKRRWRFWKRNLINHEYDRRIKYCSPFIEYISKERNDAYRYGMLYRANHINILRLESYAFDASKRFDYIKELVEKYGAMNDITRYANCIICVSFSSAHPLHEMLEIQHFFVDLLPKMFCPRVDNSLGEEIRIDVAYYE